MRALRKMKRGHGNFAVCDVPKPKIASPEDVLIKVLAAGICGTDVHIYEDKFQSYPPVTLGHEFVGLVEEIGNEAVNFKPGDRVVGEPHTLFCGKCEMCRLGNIQLCADKRSPGWGIDGAFADYLIVPELFLHHVPPNVPDSVAALAEPMAIVTHSVLERSGVEPQDVVAIVGMGPIGLLSAVAAKAGGAKSVILLGTALDEKIRASAARKMGFDKFINVEREDATERILKLTGGRGADLAVEACGAEAGINTCINIVKKCGRICVIGLPGEDTSNLQWLKMVRKVLDVNFCLSSSVSSWERGLSILSTTDCNLEPVISHQMSIEDWEQAFKNIAGGNAIKILFVPDSF